jgi:hypothetical protein
MCRRLNVMSMSLLHKLKTLDFAIINYKFLIVRFNCDMFFKMCQNWETLTYKCKFTTVSVWFGQIRFSFSFSSLSATY